MTDNAAAWIRSFVGPVAAAAMGGIAAYMGIRADLSVTIHRVDVQEQITRDHESRLREIEREKGRP